MAPWQLAGRVTAEPVASAHGSVPGRPSLPSGSARPGQQRRLTAPWQLAGRVAGHLRDYPTAPRGDPSLKGCRASVPGRPWLPPGSAAQRAVRALKITAHSSHGTPADMSRFMGSKRGWTEEHARQLGHWLRDRNAPQPDPRLGGKPTGAPRRGGGIPAGAPDASGLMSRRYSQGTGRRGERQEQLSVRMDMVSAVRRGLKLFGRPWTELPAGLADWDILLLEEREV